MRQISAVIITLNEEKNLERCLQALQNVVAEIIVVDSGSIDRTQEIAGKFKAKFITQPFLGYVAQKNFATQQASHDWVLNVDADEVLSAELQQSIQKLDDSPIEAGFQLSRLTNYCGSWIKHSGWYPDIKTRLYNKKMGQWEGEQIHEHWEPFDKQKAIGKLKGELFHYSYYTLSDHLKQIEKFSEILAHRAVQAGQTASIAKILFAPIWKFITYYFIRLGFLDGYAGFLVCKLSAFATLMKYTKIRQYAKQKNSNT